MQTNTDFSTLDITNVAATWLEAHLVSIAGAFAVLVFGWLIAKVLSRWADRVLQNSPRFDPTVADFLSSIIKYGLYALVIATVLAQFGVQTTSILAVIGSMGLAIGLALQGTLSNVASGVMILTQRPFRVGEAIHAGSIKGVVQEIGLFTTELKQFDGLYVQVPNTELWNQPIINFNRHPIRRFELLVGIGYNDSMDKARDELLALAAADERVLSDPEPIAFVNSLDESSVGIGLRIWCQTGDYAELSWDLTERVKAKFDEAGITIPFPQREVTTRAGA
ncbi:mechanosensitive ion channel domain-containing protein [uncultured Erythrobacter sp.]|uniref:mechanosensitive ion channel family protein n=1 Tax=uncultured Erythrobacter sp. TaxID=263913 RepID=UPI00260A5B0C|nr:mechanosensitive ion channel domain-containing protein [uncultured Erythrobacter sp.]